MIIIALTVLILWILYRTIRAAFRRSTLAGTLTLIAIPVLMITGMHELAATVHAL